MAGRREPFDTPGAANPVQSSLNEYKTNTVLQLLMSALTWEERWRLLQTGATGKQVIGPNLTEETNYEN